MEQKVYYYHTVPNQKVVTVNKTLSDDSHLYGKCNIEATLTAAKDLSDRAFKLYVRLNLHQDGHTFALSQVSMQKDIGLSDKRYREAVQELIQKGYLLQHSHHKSVYLFFEYPEKDSEQHREPLSPDRPAESAGQPGENNRTDRRDRQDSPAISGGEILHNNITSDKTINNTDNIIIYAPSVSEKSLIQNKKLDYCLDADSDDDSQVIDDLFKDIEEAWAEFAPTQKAKHYSWSDIAGKFLDDDGEEPCEEDMPF